MVLIDIEILFSDSYLLFHLEFDSWKNDVFLMNIDDEKWATSWKLTKWLGFARLKAEMKGNEMKGNEMKGKERKFYYFWNWFCDQLCTYMI
jgi:hypothetical protein